MGLWKYGNKEVSQEEINRAVKALQKDVCFHCGIGKHTDQCPIFNLIIEINNLKSANQPPDSEH